MDRAEDPLTVTAVCDERELVTLEDEWNQLYAEVSDPNVFASFAWVRAWWRHIGARDESQALRVYVVRDSRRVIAVAPLLIRVASRLGVRVRKLEFIGLGWNDYNDVLFRGTPAAAFEALVDAIHLDAAEWDVAELSNLRPATASCLKDAIQSTDLRFRFKKDSRCPYVALDEPLEKTVSATTRSGARRKLRRLREFGATVGITRGPEIDRSLLDRLIALEQHKKINGVEDCRILVRETPFFREVIEALAARGSVYVAAIESAEHELIAYEMGFLCGTGLWMYNKAYNSAYSSFSPGVALIGEVLAWAVSEGLDEYDFLRGEEEYKIRWTATFHENSQLLVWNPRSRSRFGAAATRALRKVRSVFQTGSDQEPC
jgi:CelD/BcsL family acetyltransferase involved in cellulose biosynthesis